MYCSVRVCGDITSLAFLFDINASNYLLSCNTDMIVLSLNKTDFLLVY